MCMYAYKYIYIHKHTYIHVCVCVHKHTHTHTHGNYVYKFQLISRNHIHMYIYVYMHVYICIGGIYICMYMYICMYVFIQGEYIYVYGGLGNFRSFFKRTLCVFLFFEFKKIKKHTGFQYSAMQSATEKVSFWKVKKIRKQNCAHWLLWIFCRWPGIVFDGNLLGTR
jgi:hypothetical protein